MFEIDPIIFELDDERVQGLQTGAIDKASFMKLIKHDDPWEFRDGKLTFVTKEEQQKRFDNYTEQYKAGLKKTGGLHPNIVYDNAAKFVQVYPELKENVESAENAIKKENCQGCARNKYLMPVMEKLFTLPNTNRDFSILEEPLNKLPFAIKRLKGEEYDVSKELPNVQGFMKREIKFIDKNKQIIQIPQAPNNPMGILRDSCMSCVQKHLSRAYILMTEVIQGYSTANGYIHESMLIAHLSEAEEESLKERPEFAAKIRELRIKLTGQTLNNKI